LHIPIYKHCKAYFAACSQTSQDAESELTKKLKFDIPYLGKQNLGERGNMVRRSVLDRIFQEMMNIRYRLDDIEKNFSNWNPQPLEISDAELLLLPDHLRRTYLTVASRGECDATVVSNLTGRCRAVESNYLNQLARMGWLNKRRVSKTINFRPICEKMIGGQVLGRECNNV
jgi:hypothetical protein